jgi:hypothetical protein
MTRRLLLLLALGASSLLPAAPTAGETTVFLSAHGKTYHSHRDCMSLSRAKTVYTATETAARAHGLTLCGICAHRKGPNAQKGSNGAWAQEAGK